MYSLEHNWTKYLYETFTADANDDMFEDVAFDVACAMITMDALMTENSMFYVGRMAAMGNNMTYNWHSMLVGSYATCSTPASCSRSTFAMARGRTCLSMWRMTKSLCEWPSSTCADT